MSGLIRMLTYSSFTIDSLLLFYFNLDVTWDMTRLFGIISRILMPKGWNASSLGLQLYVSVILFAIPCSSQLCLCIWTFKVKYLKVVSHELDALFHSHFLGSKFCPSLMDNISFRDRAYNILAGKNCPSAACSTAARSVCSDIDISSKQRVWRDFTLVAYFIWVMFFYLANMCFNFGTEWCK